LNAFKRNAVRTALIAFAVWPLLHIGLIRAYDLNPWKFAGWGMYAAPQLVCGVRILGIAPDGTDYELRSIAEPIEPALAEFRRRRNGLRGLATPDALGDAVLRHYSAIAAVRIVVVQPVLDPPSGMIHEVETRYEYRRRRAGP